MKSVKFPCLCFLRNDDGRTNSYNFSLNEPNVQHHAEAQWTIVIITYVRNDMLEWPSPSFPVWKYIRRSLLGMAFLINVYWEELVQGPLLLNFPPWFSLLSSGTHLHLGRVSLLRCWEQDETIRLPILSTNPVWNLTGLPSWHDCGLLEYILNLHPTCGMCV